MKRRKYLKTILFGSAIPCIAPSILAKTSLEYWPFPKGVSFQSKWQDWQDMKWAGPEYWGNRLQDWIIKEGKLICDITAKNRNLHLLPIQKPLTNIGFNTAVIITVLNSEIANLKEGCFGIRLGATGPVADYRSAAVFGKGIDIGLNAKANLCIGKDEIKTNLSSLPQKFGLTITAIPTNGNYTLTIHITDPNSQKLLFKHTTTELDNQLLFGNFALLAHCSNGERKFEVNQPSVAFENWSITSELLEFNESHIFGPICFAQYTLQQNKLKLTAQLAPIEAIDKHEVQLQFWKKNAWITAKTAPIEHAGRAVNFAITSFNNKEDTPYRILVKIPTKDGDFYNYEYLGTIAKEPIKKEKIKTAVFSCNAHYGFPDGDIYENVSKLNPDVILFLGDQFYEGTGGFGAMFRGDFDKTCLDYLRKWYMFGWSYRELFRHKPCAIIPDDHDVYHGNVWGEDGKKADTSNGFGATAQDSGGYKMAAEWVNMVQFTQTSHLPDAYDPAPVKQGIKVYYTQWNYAGISFAILEDRKFKSAPKHILPKDAQVNNGWIMSDNFDIKQHKDAGGELLGRRQEKFLEDWVEDWAHNAEFKVVLSQTNFATVATLPKNAKTGAVIPSLAIPEKGDYIKGDYPTVDMDSNGWPAKKRDTAVEIIRKGFSFHIAGDQHLASFIQYGLDEHEDSGFAFAGPALNNLWPRRFWPNVNSDEHSYNNPAYTGNHYDGFGNKMTVHAVANPHKMHQEPEILHNRAVGYGIITFNKNNREITTECWPRFIDPTLNTSRQYPGWPITINQEDNFNKKAIAWLPEIKVNGNVKPVIKVHDGLGNLVYAIKMKARTFKPKVFKKGYYSITVLDTATSLSKRYDGIKAKKQQKKRIIINV